MSLRVMGGRARLGLALAFGLIGCGSGGEAGSGDASDSGAETRDVGGGWALDAGESRRDAGATDASSDSGVIEPGGDAGSRPDGGAVVGPCSGKPGALRGKVQGSVDVGGEKRTFVYYAPSSLDPTRPVPLIISPHGFTMSGDEMYTLTGFKEIADREGLVAIFPDGNAGSPWNVGVGVSGWGAVAANYFSDDQAFVDAMIEYAKADQCIDAKHIFVSGFSMGGYFSNEIGCLRNDIASVGPHSGGSHDLSQCKGSIKPVIVFHGVLDWLIYYSDNGLQARDRWVARNGCGTEFDSRAVKGGACEYYRNCPDHAQVALCYFDSMGHAWAGGKVAKNGDPSVENAAELAWQFWKEYAW